MTKEIAVFGAGPAGLSTACSLADKGHNVTLIRPDTPPTFRSIYTKIDPLDTFTSHSQFSILPKLRVLTESGTDMTVATTGRYGMIDYSGSLSTIAEKISPDVNIQSFPPQELTDIVVRETKKGVKVAISGNRKTYDAVVDCTGIEANISTQVDRGRQTDYLVEYLYGGIFPGQISESMVLAIGPGGGTSWANPSIAGREYVDIVFSAWGWRSHFPRLLETAPQRLELLIAFLKLRKGIDINSDPEKIFSGLIRSQPTLRPIASHVYCVGESAGMAKPETGDSFRRAIQAGKMVATAIHQGDTPQQFHRRWRRKWFTDLFFSGATLTRLKHQKTGNLGRLIDIIGHLHKNGANPRLVQAAERFITEERISLRLILFFLKHKGWRRFVLESLKAQTKITTIPPFWSLPEV